MIALASIVLCALLARACTTENDEAVKTTGTVVYLSFEGGFYGIKGDDGRSYDPANLPEDFRTDGLRVRFEAKELTGSASFHMWGVPIELIHIRKL
jgi:hypothetical protein